MFIVLCILYLFQCSKRFRMISLSAKISNIAQEGLLLSKISHPKPPLFFFGTLEQHEVTHCLQRTNRVPKLTTKRYAFWNMISHLGT